MGTDDLVCAACGGRVGDARCATCRASLRRMQEDPTPLPAGWFFLAAALVLLLVIVLG